MGDKDEHLPRKEPGSPPVEVFDDEDSDPSALQAQLRLLQNFNRTIVLNEKARTPEPPRKLTNGEIRANEAFLSRQASLPKSPAKNVKNLRVTIGETSTQPETAIAITTPLQVADTVSDGADDGRGNWGGKMEFLFTCIGYAVGLGNVWRFPYLCYKNGGGAFLIPYILMLGLVGLPLFFMELAFGQYASLGPITIWKLNPLFKGVGLAMVAVSWLIGVYYNVVIAHVLLYMFASIRSIWGGLPWISCDNEWNTELCVEPIYAESSNGNLTAGNATTLASNASQLVTALVHNVSAHNKSFKTPSEEYYDNYVLQVSSGMDEFGGVNWKLALCLLLAWAIVLVCLIRGVQSLGKVVYFTAIFPYLMLTILFIRGVTLPGAIDGIIFYLRPDFSRLTDARVWCDAATQIFYSLSACSGGLIAMASYNKFDNNCYKDSLIVAIINCCTSVYAGFVVFSVLGFMAMEKGVEVAEVAAGGPGLVFVIYPEALSRMPVPWLWSILFFFMMATLGFGSQFSIIECVLSSITDEFHTYLRGGWQSIVFRVAVIGMSFLLGLPMVCKGGIYLLNLVDYSVSGFPLLFVGFFELVAIHWIYGYHKFSENIHMMLGFSPNIYWKICWMIISPLVILVTVIFNCIFYKSPTMDEYVYPGWAEGLGWCIALFPILLMPGVFLISFCARGGYQALKRAMKPTDEWGPSIALEPKEDGFALGGRTPLTPAEFDGAGRFAFEFNDRTIKISGEKSELSDNALSRSLRSIRNSLSGSLASLRRSSMNVAQETGKNSLEVPPPHTHLLTGSDCSAESQQSDSVA